MLRKGLVSVAIPAELRDRFALGLQAEDASSLRLG
jgi:hypothetical protein